LLHIDLHGRILVAAGPARRDSDDLAHVKPLHGLRDATLTAAAD
jgi:hypothetical protein